MWVCASEVEKLLGRKLYLLRVTVLEPTSLITTDPVQRMNESGEKLDSRQQGLLNVPPQLFSCHNNHQLRGQLNQTASRVTLGQQEVFSLYNTLSLTHFLPAVPDYEAEEMRLEPSPFLWGRLRKEFSTQSNVNHKNSPPHSSVCSICQTCICSHQDSPQICL